MFANLSNVMHLQYGVIVGGWLLPIFLMAALGVVVFLVFKYRRKSNKAEFLKPREPKVFDAASATRERERSAPNPGKSISAPRSKGKAVESYAIDDLPIGQISEISDPGPIDILPVSEDAGLLAAIEEIQDDSDADAEFRAIALRVMGGFRTRNSIDALSQIALYDLSTNLRSRAVAMLADLDHPSVFEAIVLSCADPSREVRAAGARALFRVTFDRGEEWARFALSDEKYLGRQIARAVVEAGLGERAFDRLTLRDEKAVYEAFALVYLLVKAGETDKVFQAIRNHQDIKIRLALLHILKVANVAEVIPHLTAFIAAEPISSPVADKARETLLGITAQPVDV